jgi:ornithine cyclodeaminase
MLEVRAVEEFRVCSRDRQRAEAFASVQADLHDVPVRAASAEEAAACDIVCTVTASKTPVLFGAWVGPGTHVNLVGAHGAEHREADSSLIAKGALYVDSLVSLEFEGGDLRIPMQEGVIDASCIRGEIGGVLSGIVAGRRDDQEITIYNSVGLAPQDLFAVAELLYGPC